MKPETTPKGLGAILSQPRGLKAGPSPGTLMPVKGQGPFLPAGNTPGFTGVKGPAFAAPLSFPQQHSHSWGMDRHTAPLLPWLEDTAGLFAQLS